MHLVMIFINNGGNSSHNPVIHYGQKKSSLSMMIKGMLILIQKDFLINKKRRNPIGIIAIDHPRKTHKQLQFTIGFYRDNFDPIHSAGSNVTAYTNFLCSEHPTPGSTLGFEQRAPGRTVQETALDIALHFIEERQGRRKG